MSVINTNITSMIGQQNLNASKSALTTSMERLSSGLRINSAKDDAAGQAIANRMSSQITGLSQAQRNANDGISIAQTAEGALNQVNDNLQRVRELTVQASNGTNSKEDLQSIQDEIGQRLTEINRISEETNFNGTQVLSEEQGIQIQVGAKDGEVINVNLKEINAETLQLDKFDISEGVVATEQLGNAIANGDAVPGAAASTIDISGYTETDSDSGSDGAVTTNGNLYQDDNGDYFVSNDGSTFHAATVDTTGGEITFDGDTNATPSGTPTTVDKSAFPDPANPAISGLGTDQTLKEIQDGSGEGTGRFVIEDTSGDDPVYYAAEIADDGSVTQGEELEADPLESIDKALGDVDSLRSELGAVQNRFESAITNLSTNETNLSAARSRIEDADYAVEVANMTRAQILQQAGTSVLAQANQVPQSVLSLLG